MGLDPQQLATRCPSLLRARRLWLGYSGGVDSTVLLHLLTLVRDGAGLPPLAAVHVNHTLQEQADAWERHCARQCEALGVAFHAQRVQVTNRGEGIEAAARAARYAVFEECVGPGEALLLAHHGEDQAETLMLNLLRGTGLSGLAAMPAEREFGAGRLLRPLLGCSREQVLDYAGANSLAWIEDPSNASSDPARNFLRLEILPLLATRWPDYRRALAGTARAAADADSLLAQLAEIDGAGAAALPVAALEALAPERRDNALRHWLRVLGAPMPTRRRLRAMWSDVALARADARPQLQWGDWELRRFRERLFAFPKLPPLQTDWSGALSGAGSFALPGAGSLRSTVCDGAGLREGNYEVRFRRGGERCRAVGRSCSAPLKKLLQEAGVAPWLRDRVPLLYRAGELAAVGDLWICEGFGAAVDEPGLVLHWSAPGPRGD